MARTQVVVVGHEIALTVSPVTVGTPPTCQPVWAPSKVVYTVPAPTATHRIASKHVPTSGPAATEPPGSRKCQVSPPSVETSDFSLENARQVGKPAHEKMLAPKARGVVHKSPPVPDLAIAVMLPARQVPLPAPVAQFTTSSFGTSFT